MPDVIIRPAVPEDVDAMAPHLRDEDKAEMWAQGAFLPHDGLMFSFQNSVTFTAVEVGNPVPILMFGLGRPALLHDGRCVWLLGTDQVLKYRRRFIVESADVLHALAGGEKVFNHVLASNTLSLRWLRWLGFNIAPAKPYGWLQKPFHYVEKVIPCVPSPPQ